MKRTDPNRSRGVITKDAPRRSSVGVDFARWGWGVIRPNDSDIHNAEPVTAVTVVGQPRRQAVVTVVDWQSVTVPASSVTSLWAFRHGAGRASGSAASDVAQTKLIREANGYKAEGFSRQRVLYQ